MPASADSEAAAATRRQDLSRWLQHKRESIDPAEVGLAPSVRRRTEGLTQLDVARLAGVDRRTYQRFEQGLSRPTVQVFAAIVAALRLSAVEAKYLCYLADLTEQAGPCSLTLPQLAQLVRPLLAAIRAPALVYDATMTVVAWNDAFTETFPGVGEVDSSSVNVMRWLFTADDASRYFADLPTVQREAIGRLRASRVRYGCPRSFEQLVAQLCAASPTAKQLWDDETVLAVEPTRSTYALRGPAATVQQVTIATVSFVDDMPAGLRMAYALSEWTPPAT